MPFQVSPGVNVTEIDLTTVVPAVSSTEGALAGVFRWGPVDERSLVSSETELVARYGKPTNFNAETFFTAANFLAYGNKLYVARTAKTTNANNITIQLAAGTNFNVGDTVFQRVGGSSNTGVGTVVAVSGNTITVNVATTQGTFSSAANLASSNASPGNQTVTLVTTDTAIAISAVANADLITNIYKYTIKNADVYDQKDTNGDLDDDTDAVFIAKYPGALGNSLKVSVCDSATAYSSDTDLTSGGNTFISATASKVSAAVGSVTTNVIVAANTLAGQLAVSTVSGTFNVGDPVFQSNGSVNVAIGTVASVNISGGAGTIGVTSTVSQNTSWALYTAGSFVITDASTSATARVTGRFVENLPTTVANNILQSITIGDYVQLGNNTIGKQFSQITAVGGLTTNSTAVSFTITSESKYALGVDYDSSAGVNQFSRRWEYFNSVAASPGTTTYVSDFGNTAASDEIHIVVADQDGDITGVPGTVLEVFQGLSRATDAKTQDGATNFYKTVINDVSQYIWYGNARSGASNCSQHHLIW
jgi:hypothetical protein